MRKIVRFVIFMNHSIIRLCKEINLHSSNLLLILTIRVLIVINIFLFDVIMFIAYVCGKKSP